MNQEKLGVFIAKCRKEKKLTQEQLAEKLGVTDKSISRWENGRTMPDISLFEPLCDALNISINELLKGEKIENKKLSTKLTIQTLIDYRKYADKKNKKVILTILYFMSLAPMLLNQYGGLRGVQEISGLINLFNPIGALSIILFILGIWMPLRNEKINKFLGSLGVVGIVISEIYSFFTWHVSNVTGKINIYDSIRLAFPEFYIGLVVSLIMVIIYFFIDKIMN